MIHELIKKLLFNDSNDISVDINFLKLHLTLEGTMFTIATYTIEILHWIDTENISICHNGHASYIYGFPKYTK